MNLEAKVLKRLQQDYGISFFPRFRGAVAAEGLDARFERFSQHLPGRFMPLGAYSYSLSFTKNISQVGRYCSIAEGVEVMGSQHPVDWASSSPAFYNPKRARLWGSQREDFPRFRGFGAPVEVGHDVWLGSGVLLAHGVKIGTGAVVAARAIVTSDVPPYSIVGGTPARLIRRRFDDETVERLLKSQWWTWPLEAWDSVDPRNVSQFLDRIDELRDTEAPLAESRFTAREILAGVSGSDTA